MCRAKGTFSACLGPRCSLARRGSARFSECAPYDHISLFLSLTHAHALLFSFSLAPDPAYHGFSAPLFLLLFPRECPVREPSASRFQEDSNREPIGLVGLEYLIGVWLASWWSYSVLLVFLVLIPSFFKS